MDVMLPLLRLPGLIVGPVTDGALRVLCSSTEAESRKLTLLAVLRLPLSLSSEAILCVSSTEISSPLPLSSDRPLLTVFIEFNEIRRLRLLDRVTSMSSEA